MKDLINNKYWGITFNSWNDVWDSSAVWSASAVELFADALAGITFPDGSKLISKPGNVTSEGSVWKENYWAGTQSAPLSFFRNDDIGNNDVVFSDKDLMGYTSYGLFNYSHPDSTSLTPFLRADNIFSYGTKYFDGDLITNKIWSRYSGSLAQAYNYSTYRISDRDDIKRIRIMDYGNYWNVNVTADLTKPFMGHFTTKWYIENTNLTQSCSLVPTGITLGTKAGVTSPTIAPGEIWCVEFTVYTASSNSNQPIFTLTDAYQIQ